MTETEYREQLQSIFNLCALVRRLKITPVLRQIERAETLGPIVNPTLYRHALTSLEWQRKCAQAALRFQQAVNDIATDYIHFHPGGKRQ